MIGNLRSNYLSKAAILLVIVGLTAASLAAATTARADVNPWIRSNLFNAGKWDTAGPGTATPWLHPPEWTPNQGWGLFGGNLQASNVTGSWGGVRDKLVKRGISFQSAYLGQFSANPVGGESQGQSWRSDFAAGVFVDLDRLFDVHRTYFLASLDYEDGTPSLTPAHVGNQFPVQLATDNVNRFVRLVHLAAGTQLFDNTVAASAGRMITGEQYAYLAQACNSLNQAICSNPIAGARTATFLTYPDAGWGVNFEYKPSYSWYAKAGAYMVDSDLRDQTDGGVNFGIPDGAGPLVLGEIGYLTGKPNFVGTGQGRGIDPSSVFVLGTYKAGIFYDGEELENLSSGELQRHTWGFYAMGEQRIYGERPHSDDGLWTWLALSYAPPDVNEVEFMVAGGVSYNGLLDSRPDDTLSFTFAHGQFSDRLDDQGAETLIEFGARIQALPSAYFEPNLQYIINPNGFADIDNALVAGFAIGFNF